MAKKESLVKALEEYRDRYFEITKNFPEYIPVTPAEFQQIKEYIAEFLEAYKDDTTYYFYYDDEITILQWKGAEIYETATAVKQRKSLKK